MNNIDVDFHFLDARLDSTTAVLATGFSAVSIFVNDTADEEVLQQLSGLGVVAAPVDSSTNRVAHAAVRK